jgi:hypothetical protein
MQELASEEPAGRERFARNFTWFKAHTSEIYSRHRGKCICIAGEELFAAKTTQEATTLATQAHPVTTAILFTTSQKKAHAHLMQIQGEWLECEDGILRPVILGSALAADQKRLKNGVLQEPPLDF